MSIADVLARCDILADLSETPHALTRTFLCPAMHDVHHVLTAWMTAAGMTVRTDGIGNLIGHYAAQTQDAPILVMGSHLDTVPDAGKYDGALGVLLALHAVESLAGKRLPFAIDIIGFSEEEGVRFGVPYLGSLGLTGALTKAHLALTDDAGISAASAMRAFGLDPRAVLASEYQSASILGYLEAHIEQGPVLETFGLPLGAVTAIAGQSRLRVEFHGEAGHAGTNPMALRRDAATGAAEWTLAVEACGLQVPGLVATVGMMTLMPGASNVIPGAAHLSLDIRHEDDAVRTSACQRLLSEADAIAKRRDLRFTLESEMHQASIQMDTPLTETLTLAAADAQYQLHPMVSGAGHDAAIMACSMPAALLFIRSPGGLSHHPDEAVHTGDVDAATQVISHFMVRLASSIREIR